ncbi:flagellar hook-basal body complex protein [bacterium]|nr:flagellar hook-basal body complex protein [bacterium]
MYNLKAVIAEGMNNATTQFDRMGYIADNISNYNTNGYKSVRFEQMLHEDGYLTGAIRTDYKNGSLVVTKNELDVGINGAGFIPVTSADGKVAYTRDGAFKVRKDGYLATNDDWIVGGGIQIPANYYKLQIKQNGDVNVMDREGDEPRKIGKIPLVNFQNPEGLMETDNNKLSPTSDAGKATLIKDHQSICQYQIEHSNTNIFNSVSEMLRINASMLASIRMMKTVDDMYNKGINIRQS